MKETFDQGGREVFFLLNVIKRPEKESDLKNGREI